MKKLIFTLLLACTCSTAFAGNEAKISVHISDPVKANKYFMCVYNVGCISIKAGNRGKTFAMPAMNMGNIIKFVVTDVETMREYYQPSNPSCNVKVKPGQKLSITGTLVVHNAKPSIKNLHCHVA